MSRRKKYRLIQIPPHFSGFEPIGIKNQFDSSQVILNYDEYEAIKLCDYELLNQEEAASLMNVSRPTFTRIYESARKKVAKAFVEGSEITFVEGKNEIPLWHRCENCSTVFSLVDVDSKFCPLCKGKNIVPHESSNNSK